MFYFNVFILLRMWPGFTKKPRNFKAIWTSKIRCTNRALMVGALTPPRSLILCVICNRGWRLVKIGFYVYFNVRWGRRRAHHFVIAARRSNACSMLKDRNVRDYTTCCEPFRKCLNIACVLSCSRSIIKNTINTQGKLKVSESLFFAKLT